MPNRDLNNMRQSYEATYLLEEDCDSNPFIQFAMFIASFRAGIITLIFVLGCSSAAW